MAGKVSTDSSADWAMAQDGLPSIYTAAHSAEVHAARERYGRDTVGTTIEALFAATARGFVASALAG